MLTDQILQTVALIVSIYLLILLGAWLVKRTDGVIDVLAFTAIAIVFCAVAAVVLGGILLILFLLSLAFKVSLVCGWVCVVLVSWIFFTAVSLEDTDLPHAILWGAVATVALAVVGGVLTVLSNIWGWE